MLAVAVAALAGSRLQQVSLRFLHAVLHVPASEQQLPAHAD